MWSEKQIELSRQLLNCSGVSVKSSNGEFGVLRIEDNPPNYKVLFYDEAKTATFYSVDEMIKAGWAVD